MRAMSTSVEHAHVIPSWTLADRLRKARSLVGKDQRGFAADLGVKPSAYAQWEAGRAKPRDLIAMARRVELITRVPASWLLGLDSDNPRPGGPDGGGMLPRLDSNQQPSGYMSAQIIAGPWGDVEGAAA